MKHLSTPGKLLIVGIVLFGVVVCTSYLQIIFHLNTYLALAVCLADTVIAAKLLFYLQK